MYVCSSSLVGVLEHHMSAEVPQRNNDLSTRCDFVDVPIKKPRGVLRPAPCHAIAPWEQCRLHP